MALNFYVSIVASVSFPVLRLLLCVHRIQDSFLREHFHEAPRITVQVFVVVLDFRPLLVLLTCVQLILLSLWQGSSVFAQDWNLFRIRLLPL